MCRGSGDWEIAEGGEKMTITEYQVIVAGNLSSSALAAKTPLSFWGGVDVATGMIQDIHHDLCGLNLTGKVLCIPFDRGSCSGSGVLLEMIRQRTAPAGILCLGAEAVLALGPIIGEKMYQRGIAIRTVSEEVFRQVQTGDLICFTDEEIIIEKKGEQ